MRFRNIFLMLITLAFSTMSVAEPKPSNLTHVKVQLKWRHQFQFAGFYAAIEQGYYQDVGLNVTLIEREVGPSPIKKIILGEVDYAVGGVGALIYRANGVPLVALAATFQHSPSVLFSRYPALNDLKNKKIMLTRGVMNAEIITMLEREKIVQEDFFLVPSNISLQGFIDGSHDAYNGYVTNELYQLQQQNIPFYIFNPKDYNIDFYGDILLTTENKINQNLLEAQKFTEATNKGWEYAIENVEETIDLIINKYNSQKKSRELLTFEANELIKLIMSDLVPIGYMSDHRWALIADVLDDSGYLEKDNIDFDKFLLSHHDKTSIADVIAENTTEIIVISVVIIALILLGHNYHLKVIVKERTKLLEELNLKAEREARTDSLTQLANRKHFMEIIEHDISIAKRNHFELSLIYIDIDFFKEINDTYGHAAGDVALKSLAKILQENVRASDTAARMGGEEFVILCLEKNKKDTIHLAERIRKEVENHIFQYENISFKLTISLGVSTIFGDESLTEVLKKSDKALYKAKESGRNQVQSL